MSYTWDNTEIYLYDVPGGSASFTLAGHPSYKLEANWDDRGAICLHHVRYELLVPECKKKFKQVKIDAGTDYYCRNGPGDINSGPLIDYSEMK